MTTRSSLHDRYRSDSIETMTPGRMVVALYDRLLLDLERAQVAIAKHDRAAAHDALMHAQEIVALLHDSLDVSSWVGGAALASIYEYLSQQLIAANVAKDAAIIATCAEVITPLRDSWREIAAISPAVNPQRVE